MKTRASRFAATATGWQPVLLCRWNCGRCRKFVHEILHGRRRLRAVLQPMVVTFHVDRHLFFLFVLDGIVMTQLFEVRALPFHARIGDNDTKKCPVSTPELLQSDSDHSFLPFHNGRATLSRGQASLPFLLLDLPAAPHARA